MRYVVKLWTAWAGWKNGRKNSIFSFLYCFWPKEWEKVVPKVKFLVWEESAFLGQSNLHCVQSPRWFNDIFLPKDVWCIIIHHLFETQLSPKLPWGITSWFYRLRVVFRFVVMGFGGYFDFWGRMGLPRQLNVSIGWKQGFTVDSRKWLLFLQLLAKGWDIFSIS